MKVHLPCNNSSSYMYNSTSTHYSYKKAKVVVNFNQVAQIIINNVKNTVSLPPSLVWRYRRATPPTARLSLVWQLRRLASTPPLSLPHAQRLCIAATLPAQPSSLLRRPWFSIAAPFVIPSPVHIGRSRCNIVSPGSLATQLGGHSPRPSPARGVSSLSLWPT